MDFTQFGELRSRFLFLRATFIACSKQLHKTTKQTPNAAQYLSFVGTDEFKIALGATKMVISVAPIADLSHPSQSAR